MSGTMWIEKFTFNQRGYYNFKCTYIEQKKLQDDAKFCTSVKHL